MAPVGYAPHPLMCVRRMITSSLPVASSGSWQALAVVPKKSRAISVKGERKGFLQSEHPHILYPMHGLKNPRLKNFLRGT
jgi:hypothetical protein